MLKQPRGTNHFQFRFHQFGLGAGGTGGGICSMELSTLSAKSLATNLCKAVLCNWSRDVPVPHGLRARPSPPVLSVLDGFRCREQDVRHETTKLSPNYFCRRFDNARRCVCNGSHVRPGRARRHMDQLARHCVDNQCRRHISRNNC